MMRVFQAFPLLASILAQEPGEEIIHQGRSFFVGQSRIKSIDPMEVNPLLPNEKKKGDDDPDDEFIGDSLCYERITAGIPPCCDDINLECYGCNPFLIEDGVPCLEQPTDSLQTHSRDCFCDASCIIFKDCCVDHPITCKHLYTSTTTQRSTTTTSTTTTTTTTTVTTTTKTTTTKTTTTTTTLEKPTESWIFRRLFKIFNDLSAEKYSSSPKMSRMKKKILHVYNWLLNAEHRCRFFIAPLIEDPDDGSITEYNYYWSVTEDTSQPISGRFATLGSAFQKYIGGYYWDAPRKRLIRKRALIS